MARNVVRARHLAAIVLSTLALAGCNNFENPLNWDESPAAEDLVGSWRGTAGDDTGTRIRVSRTDDQGLRFDLTYPDGTPATTKTDAVKHRAEFRADLLRSESVDVLQILASSYEEFDPSGKSLGTGGSGYLFRRVFLTPGEGASVHGLNRSVLGPVAEAELADAGIEMDVDKVSGCLGEKVRLNIWSDLWQAIDEELDGGLKALLAAAQDEDEAAPNEFEQQLKALDDLQVDPYRELARMRNCVSRSLPSEALGQILSSHADRLFSGSADRYARE